jgi:hypothetical protein
MSTTPRPRRRPRRTKNGNATSAAEIHGPDVAPRRERDVWTQEDTMSSARDVRPGHRPVLAVIAVLATGGWDEGDCHGPLPDPPDAAPPDAAVADAMPDAPPPAHHLEVLRTEPFTAYGRTFTTTLARITRPDGARTYVQWIRSDLPVRPVVVVTLPYSGIDWTGEELDERWAATTPLPGDVYLDVDGPGFDGTSVILYEPFPVARGNQEAIAHLVNDFSVLFVFARFYSGGSPRDDSADMAAGMWFLAEQPDIDRRRIATAGGSWGGFLSLHAAAHADPRLSVAVTSSYFPPADLAMWVDHARSREGDALSFMQPYLRRIYSATGGPPEDPASDFAGLRIADLCGRIPRETLLVHDQHDNLVPFAESQALVAQCGADPVYWLREGTVAPDTVDHGPLTREPPPPSFALFGGAYVHLRLATPGQSVFERYSPGALVEHLTLVRQARDRGEDVGFAAPRLMELCDPRLTLVELGTGAVVSGAEAVARAVNQVFGTAHEAATIRAVLAGGLPAA